MAQWPTPSLRYCIDIRHSQDREMRYSIRKRSTKSREHFLCRKTQTFFNSSYKSLICKVDLAG